MNDLYATRMVQTELAARRRRAAAYRTARTVKRARRLERRAARSRPALIQAIRAWRTATRGQASPC